VFDIFENEKVNADSLLQGMFGQTQGIGSTSISKSNNTSISEKVNDTNTNLSNVDASDKKIIKIVDFDKEKKLREEGIQKKIKVKYF
jgi:coproporphyrinogen III oxidase-like Fe-S oxidoreductase